MDTEALSCNDCGAELRVTPATNFVTCNRCGAHLAVHRSGGASWTERKHDESLPQALAKTHSDPLPPVSGTLPVTSEQLAEIALHQELGHIDRQWEVERQQFLVMDRWGQQHVPQPGTEKVFGAIAGFQKVGVGFAVAFGGLVAVLWMFLFRDAPFPINVLGPLFALGFILFALFGGLAFSRVVGPLQATYREKVEQYQAAHEAYQKKRQEVLRRHGRG